MISLLQEGQDSPLDISESSFAMKNKENQSQIEFYEMDAEERAINQILGKSVASLPQKSQKVSQQLRSLKTKSARGVIRGKGGRPLLTKLRPQFEIKRVKVLKKIISKSKSLPQQSKRLRKTMKKLKYQHQEIIGKNRQRKGKKPNVDLNLIRKKKLKKKMKKKK